MEAGTGTLTENGASARSGNRQTAKRGSRLCRHRKAMGGGENLRVVGTMQEVGKGLGEIPVLFKCMAHHRGHQATIQIRRKNNGINDLILSQTLIQVT